MAYPANTGYSRVGSLAFESPESIRRKVATLGEAFRRLAKDYPESSLAQSELKAYEDFRQSVETNWLSRFFASSTAPEFESWQLRYQDAYDRLKTDFPTIRTSAPQPSSIVLGGGSSWMPLIFAGIAGAALVGLLVVFSRNR